MAGILYLASAKGIMEPWEENTEGKGLVGQTPTVVPSQGPSPALSTGLRTGILPAEQVKGGWYCAHIHTLRVFLEPTERWEASALCLRFYSALSGKGRPQAEEVPRRPSSEWSESSGPLPGWFWVPGVCCPHLRPCGLGWVPRMESMPAQHA